ncbi:ABC transporter ATP-binding protein [Kitasatospora viridis]|uniref:ABC transporter ATP-binding protein n=1 Tax=Kitasatospora viridis TaxID=281105 RepID=UPI001FE33F64|nr:ABC transporter ATP-binding protein [Kitasatospora viridis]
MSPATPAIEVAGIGRVFGRQAQEVTALREVTFEVAQGEIVALLGGNGAGKTTLLKILSTVLTPSWGTARVQGFDAVEQPRRVREALGVVFGGDRGLYGRLSARDNLRYFGMLGELGRAQLRRRIPEVLAQVHLEQAADRRVETFSKGMRQRLHLAIGLLTRPSVLLLDEPTVGLDPVEAQSLRETVLALRDEGVAILLTSHYLLDVERLAQRVVLLHEGVVKQQCSLAEFTRQVGHVATVTVRGTGVLPDLAARPPQDLSTLAVRQEGDSWEIDVWPKEWSADVFTELGRLFGGVAVRDVRVQDMRLEEAFASQSGPGRAEEAAP